MTSVLVVDDSAADRRIAGGLLERNLGWDIAYASDGLQAMASVRSKIPDMVLTDLQMPEMNGLELVQQMRRQYPLIPVVLMTAQGSEAIAVQALDHGAASYVPKSHLAIDLCETLERVLAVAGTRRMQRSLMQRMDSLECSFTLTNDPGLLTSLVSYVQSLLSELGILDESDRLRAGVALEEALLNAAYHGNLEVSSELRETDHSAYYAMAQQRLQTPPYSNRAIRIHAHFSPREVQYTIRDEGPGFDPASLPDPTDPANLDRPCGRGLLLMRTFMDSITYNDAGNQVVMLKRPSPRPNTKPSALLQDAEDDND
jgi:CheY-like chemotaxis protein/anti-sigma regulatory factor (Ser/Thr protein kinase)